MSTDRGLSPQRSDATASQPSDDFLVAQIASGDSTALRGLMERYDRLVRFTIYRTARTYCDRDPHGLDSIASEVWTGFVRSLQRDDSGPLASVRAYLCRVAFNRAVSVLRVHPAISNETSMSDEEQAESFQDSKAPDPMLLSMELEELEALRNCVDAMNDEDRTLVSELPMIMERKWREAAASLRLPESTLRSRWDRILKGLKACMEEKLS